MSKLNKHWWTNMNKHAKQTRIYQMWVMRQAQTIKNKRIIHKQTWSGKLSVHQKVCNHSCLFVFIRGFKMEMHFSCLVLGAKKQECINKFEVENRMHDRSRKIYAKWRWKISSQKLDAKKLYGWKSYKSVTGCKLFCTSFDNLIFEKKLSGL